MLTLRTLKELIDTPKRGEKLPTPKQLRTGESPVVAHKTTGAGVNEGHIIVYQSGYAVYGIGNRVTVFPVNLELGYGYSSVTEKIFLSGLIYGICIHIVGLRLSDSKLDYVA